MAHVSTPRPQGENPCGDFDEPHNYSQRDFESSLQCSSAAVTAEQCRAKRLLLREPEYVSSPQFSQCEAAREILAPMPESPSGADYRSSNPPPGTPPYLADLYRIPLLSPEQEHHQFRKMNYLKYRANCLRRRINPDRPDVALMDQMEALLADAEQIRNDIINANLRLVVAVAKKLVDNANSFDDLVAEGNVPLIRAVEIFDFERGTRFSTYATWAIRNTLMRVKPRNRNRRSRYQTGQEGWFEGLQDSRATVNSLETYHLGIRQALEKVMPILSDREDFIVRARFGLDDTEQPQRYREIAEQLDLSTERVRQLLVRSLERMKEYATTEEIDLPEEFLELMAAGEEQEA